MIRQYARRVADLWHEQFGRRPAVHAHTSMMVNYRYPQPLADPQADLAKVPYKALAHNQWILPLQSERIGVGYTDSPSQRR